MTKIRISDMVTTSRIVLIAVIVAVLSISPKTFGLFPGLIIILFTFLTDTLDGIVARALKEESKMGAFYDIVGDRIFETAMLVPFVYMQIASPFILIYFVIKNFLIDFQRFMEFAGSNKVPFKQLNSPLPKFLVSSPIMRSSYSVSKILMILSFYSLIFVDREELKIFAIVMSVITIVVSLLRAIPPFLTKKTT
jgi:phosphatidylglycerophosphate synthase